jgi:Family of unknown function (DUF6127)
MLARAVEEGARRSLSDVGLGGKDAVLTIHDMRSLLECISFFRRAAVQTAVRVITTGALIALLTRIAMKAPLVRAEVGRYAMLPSAGASGRGSSATKHYADTGVRRTPDCQSAQDRVCLGGPSLSPLKIDRYDAAAADRTHAKRRMKCSRYRPQLYLVWTRIGEFCGAAVTPCRLSRIHRTAVASSAAKSCEIT